MIYAKLDWYSVMIFNRTIAQVMHNLQIDVDLYEEMLSSGYERSEGYTSKFVLSTHGISIELNLDDYLSTNESTIFQTPFRSIRLDISGSGLDYLRSIFNVDKVLANEAFWGSRLDYHVTRCDFAFDFVNYKAGFVDTFINYLKLSEINGTLTPEKRLRTGRNTGLKYSYRCGDQKTIYLGGTRADKLVRIYDKLLQYTKNGIFIKEIPLAFKDEGAIESWFRIELQSRRDCAEKFLFCENGNLENVLRVIFEDYLIRDENQKPLDFLVDLYKWENLPPIRQNQKYSKTITVLERSENFIKGGAFKAVFVYLLVHGVSGFVDLINERAKDLYINKSMASFYSLRALNVRLTTLIEELRKDYPDINIGDLNGAILNGNDVFIKKDS